MFTEPKERRRLQEEGVDNILAEAIRTLVEDRVEELLGIFFSKIGTRMLLTKTKLEGEKASKPIRLLDIIGKLFEHLITKGNLCIDVNKEGLNL